MRCLKVITRSTVVVLGQSERELMRGPWFRKLVVAITIAAVFAVFRISSEHFVDSDSGSRLIIRRSQIQRVPNQDASLSIPFLDKVSNFWYVGGGTEIRNNEFIRLTRAGSSGHHGLILSNGLGDNTIDNFETVVKFRISPKAGNMRSRLMGDGMAIVITPEKDFLLQDLASSYARRQYEINSGGIVAGDTQMMGLPKNLPGLALIIDTYKNDGKAGTPIPFLDIILNTSPSTQAYDADSDGAKTTAIKINQNKIRLKKSIMTGETVQLRLIYIESENFLKIDIQYTREGNYWIELVHTHLPTVLPRNIESNQRYIGISASTGELSQTVDILGIETNEYHLKGKDGLSKDFLREIELYFLQEFNDKIVMEKDDFQRWKMAKSRPLYQTKEKASVKPGRHGSFVQTFAFFFTILICIYLASVYIRVSIKHFLNANRGSTKRSRALPR
ncbi:hypothetical protein HG536_0F01240 [Torulaspora globosa]|uniref:L-type lectin-like domain-containing protein n=1 Tax=Torulaspora globosa TaxID=48254 RepID=A0A7G3ZJW3_9SACH|nr:uncharacterized protein HG536_0F01240 [Torulaspora globosa]QLL33799.1 hypothetical protein HG536_0F01240 [Torulaspora globosa]